MTRLTGKVAVKVYKRKTQKLIYKGLLLKSIPKDHIMKRLLIIQRIFNVLGKVRLGIDIEADHQIIESYKNIVID